MSAIMCARVVCATTMVAPTRCDPPQWLKDIVPDLQICECVDFTGDGVIDFIALGISSHPASKTGEQPLGDEWWVTSEHRVVVKKTIWESIYNYRWFAHLSDQLQPEMISAYGDPDGINYTIERIDLHSGTFEVLFYFYPILVGSDGRFYYGYPWDIIDIQTRGHGKEMKLRAAIRPREPDNGDGDNYSLPKKQTNMPQIIFFGKSTQPDIARLEPIQSRDFLLLDLVRLANGR